MSHNPKLIDAIVEGQLRKCKLIVKSNGIPLPCGGMSIC